MHHSTADSRTCANYWTPCLHALATPGNSNIQTPLPKHTWDVHIVAIWNTRGRNCTNAYNKTWWLKYLAKDIPEAKWKNQLHS
jgi:hypothetical protein